jgi:hypothetical protein
VIPGLQVCIEERNAPERIAEVAGLGYQLARIAAMTCTPDVMVQMVADVEAVGMRPLITIADPDRMRLLPGRDFECRNEDDGDLFSWEYRHILNVMAGVAMETKSRLWGPTCSNTNDRCVWWARRVRGLGWPKGLHGLSWHSYDPHENTAFDDVEALAEGRPIIFSEFGYPSLDGEDAQAEKARALWKVYEPYYGAIWFQIHDGPNPNEREHRYGIYRCDDKGVIGGLKPVAFTVPKSGDTLPILGIQEHLMFELHRALRRKEAIPHQTRPGYFTSPHPDNDGTVLCIDVGPTIGKRPAGTAGLWETWRDDGTKAIFEDAPGGAVAILLVD